MSSVKWWRVVDPLNPLCGCDVTLAPTDAGIVKFESEDGELYAAVTGLRRVDVFMGDRPFQLIRKDGEDIGLLVRLGHLEQSPIQDDIVEIAYDLPNGKCLHEEVFDSGDGDELRVVTYERATQVAYGEADGELYATCTLRGDGRTARLDKIVEAFEDEQNYDHDALVALMKMEAR